MSPYQKRLSITTSTTNSSSSEIGTKRSRSCQLAKDVLCSVSSIVDETPFLQTKPAPQITKHLAKFDRSEIILGSKLGEGAFSVVHEIAGFALQDKISEGFSRRAQQIREHYQENAVSPRTGKGRFVIKQLKPQLFDKPNVFRAAATDMAIEAAYLMRLHHENILPLRGLPVNGIQAMEDENGFFIILNRLENTLDGLIREWREAPVGLQGEADILKTKFEYSQQLAGALAYLHQRRLVFRDLKPQNIGIDRTGKLRLFDFGLCRGLPPRSHACDDVYFMSGGAGTRRYMAPEVALGHQYNCKVDVYGWSIVVWQMFSLAKPYSGYAKRDHTRYVCVGHERPTFDASLETNHEQAHYAIPKALQSLLKKAWTASISARPTMYEVIARLSRASKVTNEAGTQRETYYPILRRRHSFRR